MFDIFADLQQLFADTRTGWKRSWYVVTNCVAQQCVVLRKLKLYANVRAARFPDSTTVSLFQPQNGQLCSSQFAVTKRNYKYHAKTG